MSNKGSERQTGGADSHSLRVSDQLGNGRRLMNDNEHIGELIQKKKGLYRCLTQRVKWRQGRLRGIQLCR